VQKKAANKVGRCSMSGSSIPKKHPYYITTNPWRKPYLALLGLNNPPEASLAQ